MRKPLLDLFKGKSKISIILTFILAILIITDTYLLLLSDLSNLPGYMVAEINNFDLFVCFVLFCDFMYRLRNAEDKKAFIKNWENIVTIFAMIPINFFVFRILRYVKIVPLIFRGLVQFHKVLEKTHLNWSFEVLVVSISAGTLLFYVLEHGVNHHVHSLWDSFLYVMPTIGALGSTYSPQTLGGNVLTIVLMITGIISFGLFTASIASIYIKSDDKPNEDELKTIILTMDKEIKELRRLLEEK
jgi:Ion channel.